MPVTQKEIELSDSSSIVSKSDLKGQMNYIYDAPIMLKVGALIALQICSLLVWFNNEPLAKLLEIATVSTIVAIASLFALRKYVVLPIKRATDAANAIADGDFGFRISTKANDETGRMMQAIEAMQIRISSEVINNKKIADEGICLSLIHI